MRLLHKIDDSQSASCSDLLQRGDNEMPKLMHRHELLIDYLKLQSEQLNNLREENSKLHRYLTSMHKENNELMEELRNSKSKLVGKITTKDIKYINICDCCQVTHSLHDKSAH